MIAETAIVAGCFTIASALLIYAARTKAPGRDIPEPQEVGSSD